MFDDSSSNIFKKVLIKNKALIPLKYLHFFLLLSYTLGILCWYQYTNYFIFLLLPLLPILFCFKNKKISTIASLLILFTLGNLTASYGTKDKLGCGPINGKGTIYSLLKDYGYYKKAVIKVFLGKEHYYLDAYFKKETDLAPLDEIAFSGQIIAHREYKNFYNTPEFVKNFQKEALFLKIDSFNLLSSNSFIRLLYNLREKLKDLFLTSEVDSKFFLIQLLFGDSLLSYKEKKLFSTAGVGHILSISGLHFAITIFLGYLLVNLVLVIYPAITYKISRHYLVVIAALPLVMFYAFLSGLSIPSFRAFLGFLLFTFFFILWRSPNPLSIFSLLAFIFLFFDPTLIFNKSFQLSFLSVLILILFYKKMLNIHFLNMIKDKKILYYLINIALTSGLITLFIFPITQSLSPQSIPSTILSNLFSIPLVTFYILPLSFLSLISSFFSKTVFTIFLNLTDYGVSLFKGYLLMLAPLIKLTKLNIYFTFRGAILYMLLFFAIFSLKGKYRYFIATFLFLALILSFPKARDGAFLTFLDVGQGDCAMLHTYKGNIVFIDVGGNINDNNLFNNAFRPFLSELKHSLIYAVIISHYHPDHYKVLDDLLEFYQIKDVYAPNSEGKWPILERWERNDFQLHLINQPTEISIDDFKISLFPQNHHDKENNRSLWTVIKKDNYSFLFTGDAEKKAIRYFILKQPFLKPYLIKVPHHGAKSSFLEELYANKPNFAVISVGNRNPWKLPSKEVIEFLKAKGINVYRTDINGQVMLSFSKDKKVSLKTYK